MKQFLIALLLLFSCNVIADEKTGFDDRLVAENWRIAPKAKYHDAAVQVQVPSGSGSGVVVKHGGKGAVVVTNHHVVSRGWNQQTQDFYRETHGMANVIGSTDTPIPFQVIYSDPALDIAILRNENCKAPVAVPIYTGDVPMGSEMEMIGFGGPKKGSRAFYGKRVQSQYKLSIDAGAVSGDSGGPIMYNGALYGINWGAPGKAGTYGTVHTGPGGSWKMSGPLSSHVDGDTLAKVLTQQCGPYGCPPVIISRPPSRPAPRPSTPPPTPSTPPPLQQAGCDCDQEAIKAEVTAAVIAWLEQNKEQFRGPQGNPGMPGLPGAKGDPGKPGAVPQINMDLLMTEIVERLPPIEVETYDWDVNLKDKESYPYPGPIKIRYPNPIPYKVE